MKRPRIYSSIVKKLPLSSKPRNFLMQNWIFVIVILAVAGMMLYSNGNILSPQAAGGTEGCTNICSAGYNQRPYPDCTCYKPTATDFDGDGIPDSTDTDDDNDGYSDSEEIQAGTDPKDPDDYPGSDVPDSYNCNDVCADYEHHFVYIMGADPTQSECAQSAMENCQDAGVNLELANLIYSCCCYDCTDVQACVDDPNYDDWAIVESDCTNYAISQCHDQNLYYYTSSWNYITDCCYWDCVTCDWYRNYQGYSHYTEAVSSESECALYALNYCPPRSIPQTYFWQGRCCMYSC